MDGNGLTSRKLAATAAAIAGIVGVLAIQAFQGGVPEAQVNLSIVLIASLGGGLSAIQGAIDYAKSKGGTQ